MRSHALEREWIGAQESERPAPKAGEIVRSPTAAAARCAVVALVELEQRDAVGQQRELLLSLTSGRIATRAAQWADVRDTCVLRSSSRLVGGLADRSQVAGVWRGRDGSHSPQNAHLKAFVLVLQVKST